MTKENTYKKIKEATVAIVTMIPDGHTPFTILGSGFCIDAQGIIVTCEHVLSAFMPKSVHELIAELPPKPSGDGVQKAGPVSLLKPFAILYRTDLSSTKLFAFPSQIDLMVALTDCDLGVMRMLPHTAFPQGYPTVEIEDYDTIQEGDEISACGFPLGNFLYNQIGTVTSSFTKGIISSIIPSPGVGKNLLRGFQLNLTATHGNSGGPVFSLETGKVLGVVQQGVENRKGELIQGLSKAEAVYPIFRNNLVETVKTATSQK